MNTWDEVLRTEVFHRFLTIVRETRANSELSQNQYNSIFLAIISNV